jgi:hypothetical protein
LYCVGLLFWFQRRKVGRLHHLADRIIPHPFPDSIRDASPFARAAILYYPPFSSVVQRTVSAPIPALLDDEEVVISLATDIAYYHAPDDISESELGSLLMEILSCRNREGVHGDAMDMKVAQFYHLALWKVQRYRQHYVPRSEQNEHARSQKELNDKTKRREKYQKRKRAAIQNNLGWNWRMQSDVPLPYGCKALAEVYTDVHEVYSSSSVAALPVDGAQSVPHSNESKDIYVTPLVINLPSSSTNVRRL